MSISFNPICPYFLNTPRVRTKNIIISFHFVLGSAGNKKATKEEKAHSHRRCYHCRIGFNRCCHLPNFVYEN